ncbi:MAG: type II toxin-antitoxin system MqsA family antitoxin [Clostridia bacterium]|nr:type II toxin-antitoxin system MqsA family antitoxin [Clostridia bacterium]
MKCFMCKGNLEEQKTTFMTEFENCIVIIKNVPSLVCKQCGEVSYSDEVAKKIEELVNSVKNTITEITVINYVEKVA